MRSEYYQKIWSKALSSEEETKYEFGISEKYMKVHLIVGIIISVPLLFAMGLGVVLFLIVMFYFGFYLRAANAYAFTNKRVLIHTGWLSTSLTSIDYDKITDIKIKEGFLEKFFYNSGSMVINTAGTSLPEVVLRYIDSPYELKKKLEDIKSGNKN